MKAKAPNPDILRLFSASPTARHWTQAGFHQRAGVSTPLFSLYSRESVGIGEYPDLKLLVDWCRACGLSIIQLLPLNDVGFNFTPYDAQSMFGLDPMYLSLRELAETDPAQDARALAQLKTEFPAGGRRVDYRIKRAKLGFLSEVFARQGETCSAEFNAFREEQAFWLPDFALFKVLKDVHEQRCWEDWEEPYRRRDAKALRTFRKAHARELLFQEWLQWQAARQFEAVKAHANRHGVLLMGDLPFLVSRDSADVWAHQDYFKLDRAAGAPPDAYQARGQRWGMPPYHWEAIAAGDYDYLRHKLRYAARFYDCYRIDHFVGMFRLWTIALDEPLEHAGLVGRFDPPDEALWEEHGRRLLEVMLESTPALPCAEDLGVIPDCSYRILSRYSVVGMDVQRWFKDWERSNGFKPPDAYRPNSIAVISTHDMSVFRAWWENEAGTIDEGLFRGKCAGRGLDADALIPKLFDPSRSRDGRLYWRRELETVDAFLWALGRPADEVRDFVELYRGSYGEQARFWEFLGLRGPWQEAFTPELAQKALEAANRARSVFSIQLLQDWLAFTPVFDGLDARDLRINIPGTMGDSNWSFVLPLSLEDLLRLPANAELKALNARTGRS